MIFCENLRKLCSTWYKRFRHVINFLNDCCVFRKWATEYCSIVFVQEDPISSLFWADGAVMSQKYHMARGVLRRYITQLWGEDIFVKWVGDNCR